METLDIEFTIQGPGDRRVGQVSIPLDAVEKGLSDDPRKFWEEVFAGIGTRVAEDFQHEPLHR